MEYSYPFSTDWSTEEIVDVVQFFEGIEQAHEKGIKREVMMAKYRRFKEIVPSQAEEKTIFREFEEASGYISYPVVKQTKEAADGTMIKIVPKKVDKKVDVRTTHIRFLFFVLKNDIWHTLLQQIT